jgi:pimeloyl-ACP methyl ester carboxylesterase
MRVPSIVLGLLISLSAAFAQQSPNSPVPNSWSQGEAVEIPTGGVKIHGMFFRAHGGGLHPTAIYFHGMPGFAGDLDLPLPLSGAGWNVLTLHYRGSWGSPGGYSYAHQVEDAAAAVAFTRAPADARAYGIDTKRIVLVGHSTGGLIAIITAASVPGIRALVIVSASDDAVEAVNQYKTRAALMASKAEACQPPLAGCTSQALDAEAFDHVSSWSFAALAPRLAKMPVLMITSNDPYSTENDALEKTIRSGTGAQLTRIRMQTDHAYRGQHPALANAVIDWLRKQIR